MNYILKQYDNDLLYFSMKNTNDGLEVLINTVNQNLQYLLPSDLELSNEGLKKWLQKRTIPRNRAYVSNFLSRLGLNEKDTKGIIDICQGLSLNDVIGLCKKIVKTYLKIKIFIIILLIQILLPLLLQDMESINELNTVYRLNLQQMGCLQNHGEE